MHAYKIRKWRPSQRTATTECYEWQDEFEAIKTLSGHRAARCDKDQYRAKMMVSTSLVPRPLPDFISQLWRKIGRRPGTNTTSRTGNGGLNSYVMWTRFHSDGNVPTQCAASTASDQTVKFV